MRHSHVVSFYAEFTAICNNFPKDLTLNDDILDGFNRFDCHVCLYQGLELAGNSLSIGTNVED